MHGDPRTPGGDWADAFAGCKPRVSSHRDALLRGERHPRIASRDSPGTFWAPDLRRVLGAKIFASDGVPATLHLTSIFVPALLPVVVGLALLVAIAGEYACDSQRRWRWIPRPSCGRMPDACLQAYDDAHATQVVDSSPRAEPFGTHCAYSFGGSGERHC